MFCTNNGAALTRNFWFRHSFGMISVFLRNNYDRKMGCFSMLASTKLQHDEMISKKIA